METAFWKFLIENWPELTIVIIVAIASGLLVRKFTKWEDKHDQRHDDLDKRTMHAKCDTHETEIATIQANLKEMREDIITIKNVLVFKYKSASDVFSLKNSPRRLNVNGEKVFNDINGKEFLSAHKDFFFSKIDETRPNAALDVENAAYFVLMDNTDNEIFKGLKDFIYKSPTYTLKGGHGEDKPYDLSLPDVCFVLSLPLRDMYLEQHKELSVE